MKMCIKNLFLLPALIAGLGLVLTGRATGQTFTTLYSFTTTPPDPGPYINSDGASPNSLILSGNTLYGTANGGGSGGAGTVFALNTDGTGFRTLHNFTIPTYSGPPNNANTNSDGAYPYTGLILSGNTLYGTARDGGSGGSGTVFAVNTDGTAFRTLYSFTAVYYNPTLQALTNSDGAGPIAGLILSGNTLYGTASAGGSSGNGTVFSLVIPPRLTTILSGTNIVLTWPTDAVEFTLQSTTILVSPAVWTTNSPAPVIVNGQNTVTNPISGAQQFFRLSQ